MDIQRKKQKRFSTKIWIRSLAGFLALLLLLFIVMIDLTKVKISTDNNSKAEDAAAALLIEHTEYVEKNLLARAGDVITNAFTMPRIFSSYYSHASMQIGQGRYEEALASIERCLKEYRGNDSEILDDLWMKRGCLQTMQNDYAAALISFENISNASKDRPEILRIRVQIYIDQENLSSAKTALIKYLSVNPNDLEMRILLAELYYLIGEYALGISQYTSLIKTTGDSDGVLHYMRGILHEQTEDYDSAVSDFTTASIKGFDEALCAEQLALCSYMLGGYEEAIRTGRHALALGSDELDKTKLNKFMGLSAMSLALYKDAVSYFSDSIKNDKDTEDAHYFRAVCYMALDEFEAAIGDFTTSISFGYMSEVCYYNRAICYLQTEQMDNAKDDLRQVIASSSNEEIVELAKQILSELSN